MDNQTSEAQSFEITFKATMEANSTSVKAELKKNQDCSIAFLARCLASFFEQDKTILTATLIALESLDDKGEAATQDTKDLINLMDSYLKSKTAQV